MSGLSIGEMVEQTGVTEGTLRMWERRHAFPLPERLASGHRRYSEEQLELVRRVVAGRTAGLSLTAAIEGARRQRQAPTASLFATLRRRRPDVEPRTVSQRILSALSRAIEDESLSRAEQPIVFASFQRERFYRRQQARWNEIAQDAELAAVFADFEKYRTPGGGPAEVPVDSTHPLAREWAIVCDADRHAVCLAGREPPSSNAQAPSRLRSFETIWSVEPNVVREAARICATIASAAHPSLIEPIRHRLENEPAAPAEGQLRLAAAITNRTLSQLS